MHSCLSQDFFAGEDSIQRTTPFSTFVLLPGNMCDARMWHGGEGVIINTLGSHAPTVIHHADLTRDNNIAAMATRTLAAVQGNVLPIGFSMGAIVAVEMWCQAPERIAGLVLLGYNATADLPERAAQRPAQQADVRAGGLERVLVEELKPNYLARQNREDAALLDLLRDMGMDLGAEVFMRQSEALRCREDRREALPQINVPVLLGSGAEDSLCPPAWHEKWAAQIRASTNFSVAGAGHMLPLEAPDALAHQIERWLARKENT